MDHIADKISIYQNFGEPKEEFQSGGVIPSGSGKVDEPEDLLGDYTVLNSSTVLRLNIYRKSDGVYEFTYIAGDGSERQDYAFSRTIKRWIEDGQIMRKN